MKSDSTKSLSSFRTVPRATLRDYISLCLTTLAKLNRRHLRSLHGADCRGFYEDFFSEKDYKGWKDDERRKVRRVTVAEYLDKHVSPGATILDVGCGFGELLSGIPDVYRLHGIDYSDSNVRVAHEILHERAEVKQGSINEIHWETASCDVCICLEVIEHIEDDGRAICEITRVLRPGGILIAAVPSTYYWPQYKKLIGHYRHYTRSSFQNLLGCAGLAVIHYLPNYPNWHVSYSRYYCWARFLTMTLGRLLGQRDAFSFIWPWDEQTLMNKAKMRLSPLYEKEALMDYSEIQTSTFVVARKPDTGTKSSFHSMTIA